VALHRQAKGGRGVPNSAAMPSTASQAARSPPAKVLFEKSHHMRHHQM